jgi:hypothetical protein
MPFRIFTVVCLLNVIPACMGQKPPETLQRDERVQVDLKNGSIIMGIAAQGRLCERIGRRGYEVVEDTGVRSSGIRIWYFKNQDGFIFLPYRSIEKVTRIGALTDDDSRILRSAIAKAEASRRATATPTTLSGTPGMGTPLEPLAETPTLTEAEMALLKEFPPEDGWGSERFGEIQRKKIVMGIMPQGAELRFLDVFPAWEQALRTRNAAKALDDAKPAPAAKPAPTPPAGDQGPGAP